MNYTNAEYYNMFFTYAKCNGNSNAAAARYRELHPGKETPSAAVFRSLAIRLYSTGSVHPDRTGSARPTRISMARLDAALSRFDRDGTQSLAEISRRVGVSRSTIYRHLQEWDVEDESTDSDDVLENIKKCSNSKVEPQPSTSRDFVSKANTNSKRRTRKTVKRAELIVREENSQAVEQSRSGRKKSIDRANILAVTSDSESEIEFNVNTAQDEGKRNRSDSLDKENGTLKKRIKKGEPLTSQDTKEN